LQVLEEGVRSVASQLQIYDSQGVKLPYQCLKHQVLEMADDQYQLVLGLLKEYWTVLETRGRAYGECKVY
jgi:hypothetical protein